MQTPDFTDASNLTRHHHNWNANGLEQPHHSAYYAHEAVQIEVEVDEDVESAEVVEREQLRAPYEEHDARADYVNAHLEHDHRDDGHHFQDQLPKEAVADENARGQNEHANQHARHVNYEEAPDEVANEIPVLGI